MVGSSGALVAAIYDKYAQENHGSREPYSRKIITVKKHIFSNGELFHGKFWP
jgi:hypothetical protein